MKNRKKIIFIAGFYLVSFVVALLLTSYILNYERIHPSRNQGDTSLIKLYVKNSGMKINEMDAYVQEMNAAYLRLSVTPVSENKTITLQMSEPVTNVSKISYVLMDESNEEEIESGECPDIVRVEGQRQTEIVFTSDLQQGREYCLNLTVTDDERQTCYYYTRVVYGNNLLVYDKLQFAQNFHNATFEKTATTQIAEYLSYASDSDSDDFRNVSINSDSETVTWGDLNPEVVGDVDVTILNLDSQSGEIQMTYEIESQEESGTVYNYTVKELYELSGTGSAVTLLNYSRTMEEKLDEQSFVFNNNRMRLGMVDENKMDIHVYGKSETEEAEAESNETGEEVQTEDTTEYNTYISFVADGGLWVYNTRDNLLTQAFGFERKSQVSYRESSYRNHGVKVLRTEENGDLYFAVYGYMYNGDNEGRFGISINLYNRTDGTYSEILFIPYDKSFTMLQRGIQTMAFIDSENMLHICLEDTIYQFDIYSKQSEIVLDQSEVEESLIAEDGKSIVISHRDTSGSVSEIEWRNIETGKSRTIERTGRYLTLVGLLGENLVYGVGDTTDESRMDRLYIVDENLEVLKEYSVEGGYISGAWTDGNLLSIARKDSNQADMAMDYVLYNESESQNISTVNVYDEVRRSETWLTTEEYGYDTPVVLFARAIETYRNTQMEFQAEAEAYTGYFLYVNDDMTPYASFKEAYQMAFYSGGKVLSSQGRIISRPSVRSEEADLNGYSISLAESGEMAQQRAVIEWIMKYEKLSGEPDLSGSSMFENLQINFPDFHMVDMSGLTLYEALTMISEGEPLIVVNSEGTWCVVEGYVNGYIVVADPKDGTVSGYEADSAINGIASSGNVIYSYYK
jgi:hypothetical protein